MEFLSKFGVEWKLLLAQVVNFLVLLFVLRRFAYRPMLAFLDARSKRIEEGIRHAEEASARLAEIDVREREVLDTAKKEAAKLLADARETAKELEERLSGQARDEADRILTDARKKLDIERASLQREIRGELADLVVLATEKVIATKLSSEDDERIVQKVLAALK